MDLVQLERFKLEGFLGWGSDYEAHAATDSQTGKQVVIKRPNPDYIIRKMHRGIDRLSEQLVDLHGTIGHSLPQIARLVGYTEVTPHDGYFGDSLNEAYRVLVEERARGIPLASDLRDKFKGVPIGLGQNLFALHVLVPHSSAGYFAIHQQLLDVEEAFHRAGHLLLDMRPQNIYFEPLAAKITVIDIGTIPTVGPATQGKVSLGRQPRDVHDFYAELFRFYASPDIPPSDVAGYREPAGLRAEPDFDGQLDDMIRSFSGVKDAALQEASVTVLQKVRKRAYASFEEFRRDFNQYLALLEQRNKNLPDRQRLDNVWAEAVRMLSDEYWGRFLFDPGADLTQYRTS